MKIIISATTSWNLYNSRLGLIKALVEEGHDVVLLAPRDEYSQTLLDLGYRWEDWRLEPRGLNLFRELRSLFFLVFFYRREQPDIVHHFTPKGVIYGSFAAKLAGVNHIYNTITGLGYAFSDTSPPLLKQLFLFLYPLALANTHTIFQNPENRAYFLQKQITHPKNSILIRSSGVDINRFKFMPEPEGICRVMLSSRFVAEKGINYFADAAKILHERKVPIECVLVGKSEQDQPNAISQTQLNEWTGSGLISWWGWQEDMAIIYPKAHIVCLPTFYSEGVPKVLIEAAACRRSLIATDVPGCREIVQDGYNGILIPPKNTKALADAIELLASDAYLRKKMGRNSKRLAVDYFSAKEIIQAYLGLYRLNDK
jgi:glycosyltransferase involved in cell wall biosynthesis